MTISLDFISGMSIGIEFFTGEDLMPGDRFAMTIDLVIFRITFILESDEDNANV